MDSGRGGIFQPREQLGAQSHFRPHKLLRRLIGQRWTEVAPSLPDRTLVANLNSKLMERKSVWDKYNAICNLKARGLKVIKKRGRIGDENILRWGRQLVQMDFGVHW